MVIVLPPLLMKRLLKLRSRLEKIPPMMVQLMTIERCQNENNRNRQSLLGVVATK